MGSEMCIRDRRHHFLWRFWPVLPGWGGMAVLDPGFLVALGVDGPAAGTH